MNCPRSNLVLVVLLTACGGAGPSAEAELGTSTQAVLHGQGQQMQGQQMQGQQMQGQQMQGQQMQGQQMQGPLAALVAHRLTDVVLGDTLLENVRVERGTLVAERRTGASGETVETLRGAALVGAELVGESRTGEVTRARIAEVRAELASFDPEGSGDTLLYEVEQQATDGSWQPLCNQDAEGLRAAIPVAAVYTATGAREESTTHFTFGCTKGAIAKCYRWGYQPWRVHPGDPTLMRDMHTACTRMARADYCGDGVSHTLDGTVINIWDTVPAPTGPLQTHGEPVPGMLFEAGWDPNGAVCLAKQRWFTSPAQEVITCPDRVIPPGAYADGTALCGSLEDVLNGRAPQVYLFNESMLNIMQ